MYKTAIHNNMPQGTGQVTGHGIKVYLDIA
jgi:hypothetical protein